MSYHCRDTGFRAQQLSYNNIISRALSICITLKSHIYNIRNRDLFFLMKLNKILG